MYIELASLGMLNVELESTTSLLYRPARYLSYNDPQAICNPPSNRRHRPRSPLSKFLVFPKLFNTNYLRASRGSHHMPPNHVCKELILTF